jgi:hypothetical protein
VGTASTANTKTSVLVVGLHQHAPLQVGPLFSFSSHYQHNNTPVAPDATNEDIREIHVVLVQVWLELCKCSPEAAIDVIQAPGRCKQPCRLA